MEWHQEGNDDVFKTVPVLMIMLALVSVLLFLIPNETLVKYMGEESGIKGWGTAALLGSVALIPGFVAYPLCGILVKSAVFLFSHCSVYYYTYDDGFPDSSG